MSTSLIKFLSQFSFVEDEKRLFSEITEFLKQCYALKYSIVYSSANEVLRIKQAQSRVIFEFLTDDIKNKLELYAKNVRSYDKEQLVIHLNEGEFYLNFGSKYSQDYCMIFKVGRFIEESTLEAIAQFAQGQLRTIEHVQRLYKTQELIHIDDVTGLYNQRKLYKDLNHFVEKYNNDKDPFCVLFIDIDHFKKVNDGHGHLVGTRLIEAVALDIKHLLRDSDLCYRYGGDEFVVILSNSNAQTGKIVGERILAKILGKSFHVDLTTQKSEHSLSVSIGVAEFPTDAVNTQEVLSIADRMMYEAKESGRGVVFNTQDIFKKSLKKLVNDKKI